VRWRLAVILFWTGVAAFAFARAPGTVQHLDLRGGSHRPTEARVADSLLRSRFPKAFSEYFVVTVRGPSSFTEGPPRDALDSLLAAARRALGPHGLAGRMPGTLFLSGDGRTTFFLVGLDFPETASRCSAISRHLRNQCAGFPPGNVLTGDGRAPSSSTSGP
jgi:hypothetical protein